MSYTELLPTMLKKNLVQLRNPPVVPENPQWWYKPDANFAFHQGGPGYDIENCHPLKIEVKKLVRSGMLSFKDVDPNVQANPFPNYGTSAVNIIDGCPREYQVFYVQFIRGSLVEMHRVLGDYSDYSHDHVAYRVCSWNEKGCIK